MGLWFDSVYYCTISTYPTGGLTTKKTLNTGGSGKRQPNSAAQARYFGVTSTYHGSHLAAGVGLTDDPPNRSKLCRRTYQLTMQQCSLQDFWCSLARFTLYFSKIAQA